MIGAGQCLATAGELKELGKTQGAGAHYHVAEEENFFYVPQG